jgi:hypothetical protein
MNPTTRKDNIYVERLADDTVVYDRTNHRAHCLNDTVFKVWQEADGTRSIDELSKFVEQPPGAPLGRDVVLLSLVELEKADLLQNPESLGTREDMPSRREIGRKLALAGASASFLPFVASLVAPTPAMARSYTATNYKTELTTVKTETSKAPYSLQLALNKNNSLVDFTQAQVYGAAGNLNTSLGKTTLAQQQYQNAENEFNAMLKALGLPPL